MHRQRPITIPPPSYPGYPDETMTKITLVNSRKENWTVNKWTGDKLAEFDAVSRIQFALTVRTQNMLP